MRHNVLEAHVIKAVDRVVNGQGHEDDRIEFKADWPTEYQRAARRIAGHANASSGQEAIWVIGVDEGGCQVPGAGGMDPENWWSQVAACFEGEVPGFQVLAIPWEATSVTAICLSTDGSPYLVKNPDFGKAGVAISSEVPWREATKLRTATRRDLLRLLLPAVDKPTVEILGASASRLHTSRVYELSLTVYIEPRSFPTTFPRHRVTGMVSGVPGLDGELALEHFEFDRYGIFAADNFAESTEDGLILLRAARIKLRTKFEGPEAGDASSLRVEVCLPTQHWENEVHLRQAFEPERHDDATWTGAWLPV